MIIEFFIDLLIALSVMMVVVVLYKRFFEQDLSEWED